MSSAIAARKTFVELVDSGYAPNPTMGGSPKMSSPRAPLSSRTKPRLESLARASHITSESGLQHFLAPPSRKSRNLASHLVADLTEIARTRLAQAELLQLRDNLTQLLESSSGGFAPVSSIRASRHYESNLRASKPVSVRDVCASFSVWPPTVQRHFMRTVFALGGLSHCMWQEEGEASELTELGAKGMGAVASPRGTVAGDAAATEPLRIGASSERLQPLGLALPLIHGMPPGTSHPMPPAPMRSPRVPNASPRGVEISAVSDGVLASAGSVRSKARRQQLCDGVSAALCQYPPTLATDGNAVRESEAELKAEVKVSHAQVHARLAQVSALLNRQFGCEHSLCHLVHSGGQSSVHSSGQSSARLFTAAVDGAPAPSPPPPVPPRMLSSTPTTRAGVTNHMSGEGSIDEAHSDGQGSDGLVGGSVLAAGEPLCLQSAEADPRFRRTSAAALLPGVRVRSLLAAPIPTSTHGGPPLGVIELVNAQGSWGFTPSEQADLVAICATLGPFLIRAMPHAP